MALCMPIYYASAMDEADHPNLPAAEAKRRTVIAVVQPELGG